MWLPGKIRERFDDLRCHAQRRQQYGRGRQAWWSPAARSCVLCGIVTEHYESFVAVLARLSRITSNMLWDFLGKAHDGDHRRTIIFDGAGETCVRAPKTGR